MTQAPIALRKFAGFIPPEKNYFHMPNEWIDICAEIRDISELKVIQYILRHTWGFREYGICKTISVDEFMQGRRRQDGSRMDKGTGLSEQGVRNGIKQAIEDGYLICEIDVSDAGRVKKSYALKMVELGVQSLYPPQTLYPPQSLESGVQTLDPQVQTLGARGLNFIPRTEKDTIERHYKKDTKETQEREVANATARSQSSQETSQDETIKREAVKPSQKDTAHGTSAHSASSSPVVGNAGSPASNRTERQDTNKVTQPPAPRKPPANTIPKRPKQQPVTMPEPEPIPEKAVSIMDRWDAVHKKPAPRTPKTIQAAQLLMVYDPSEDELRDCEKWLYTTDRPGKPWYRSHGVHLPDIAEKIGSWQSLQDAPKPPDKDESNEHRVSSFGTPGYNFADEFYPSEAEKKRYRAAQQAQEVKA